MQKQFYSVIVVFSVLLLNPGCTHKDPKDACADKTIVVNGTVEKSTDNDGVIAANASGSSDFSFKLDNGNYQTNGSFTGLAPGSYTVTAKDNAGCTSNKSFTVEPSKVYLIGQGTWKFSNAKVGGIDVTAFVQACQKDNIADFHINGTCTLDEGLTKCNAGDPQTSAITWALQTNETMLYVSTPLFTGGSSTFLLVNLTATQLVVSQTMTINGIPQNVVVTFIH
jgi:hypothetical protein